MTAKKKAAKNAELAQAEQAIAVLTKHFGADAAATLRDGCRSEVKEILPTGIDVLDHHVLGIGGLPYGRVVEVSGKESTAKSSLLWQCMGQAQRDGALVVFAESEQAVHPPWVDKFGVDRGKVVAINADSFEDFASEVSVLLEESKAKKFFIGLDSVDSLRLRAQIDAELDDKDVPGAVAKAWSKFMRQVTAVLPERNALLFLTNQVRAKIGVQFGAQTTTSGGFAIPFYASVRLSMWRDSNEKKGDEKTGAWTGFRAIKNKVATPQREAHALLSFQGGWDNDASTLEFARAAGAAQGKRGDKPATTVEEARANLGWGPRIIDVEAAE